MSGGSLEDRDGDPVYRFDEPNPYDAARAESDLAHIAKKRREIEWYQGNIIRAEEKIARAEERLKLFAINYRATVGGSQISMANGFVEVRKMRERTEIYDREAWQEWLKAEVWHTSFYDVTTKLNESKVKDTLQLAEDGSFVFGETSEVVPGIRRVKHGPLDFTVKINAGRISTEETDDADAE